MKKFSNNAIKIKRDELIEKPSAWWWGGLGFVMLICLVNYCYVDLQMIVRHSMNLWDSLFENGLFDFYKTGSQLSIGSTNPQSGEVPYDIWLYIPIAIWNLPTYIWEKITGLTFETNLGALVWARVGSMLPFIGCNWALWRIGEQLKIEDVKKIWVCYFFSSSLFLMNGLFCLGQIDIYNTFFMLMGLAAYMRKDRNKFFIWFALAITCKMFALFVFIPLLILSEKRIMYMIRGGVLALSLSLLSKSLFFFDKMATPTQFDERRFIRLLFERRVDLSGITVSLFVILFFSLLIWCWYTKLEDVNKESMAVWVAFAGYSCFLLGSTTLPYWAVVYSPFVPLLLFLFPERAKIVIWLETIAGAAYFVMGLCNYGYAYAASANIRWMLTGILNEREVRGIDFSKFYQSLSVGAGQNLEALLTGIFMVAVIAILVITWPGRKQYQICALKIDKGSIGIRLVLNSFLVLIPLILYIVF